MTVRRITLSSDGRRSENLLNLRKIQCGKCQIYRPWNNYEIKVPLFLLRDILAIQLSTVLFCPCPSSLLFAAAAAARDEIANISKIPTLCPPKSTFFLCLPDSILLLLRVFHRPCPRQINSHSTGKGIPPFSSSSDPFEGLARIWSISL